MNIIYLLIVLGLLIISLNLAMYGQLKDSDGFKMAGWMSFSMIAFIMGVVAFLAPVGKDKIEMVEPIGIFSDSVRAVYIVNDSLPLISTKIEEAHSPQSFTVCRLQKHDAWGLELEAPKYSIVRKK